MAPNPILAQMAQSQAANAVPNKLAQVKNLISTVRNAGNPAAMLQSVLGNNPLYTQAQELIRQNGGDARAAFVGLAQQNGIDPNDILNLMK